jgi:hypothetical protein
MVFVLNHFMNYNGEQISYNKLNKSLKYKHIVIKIINYENNICDCVYLLLFDKLVNRITPNRRIRFS